jgi:hypothetical protein
MEQLEVHVGGRDEVLARRAIVQGELRAIDDLLSGFVAEAGAASTLHL